ncbi:MAG: AAA family ATPase [Candidatus Bathyarchaeia archaeon]
MSGKEVILITGMPGSGKTTASNLMKEKGYQTITMGDVIRGIADARGIEPTQTNLGELAEEIRKKRGDAAVAEECFKLIEKAHSERIAIDGIRSLDEVEAFRRVFRARLVAVHSRPKIRFNRLRNRGRGDDPDTWRKFTERDRRELEFGIGSAIALADHMLVNEDGIKSLREKFDDIMEEL